MSRKNRKVGGGRSKSAASRKKKAQRSSKKNTATKALPSKLEDPTTNNMADGDFRIDTEILKVDEELGLVLGWAIVSTIDGEPYFDLQGDHIPDDSMLKAAADFMLNSRVAGHMHKGQEIEKAEERGSVVFAFPMTAEIAKVFGVQTRKTGLMIAMKPDDEMMEKFKDGTLTGFSIGGHRGVDEEVVLA